jgi:hypothetical protein
MAYIDNPYANSLRQAQAMPAVQQALGGYEGGMDGLMRLFQQQQIQQQPKRYNPGEDTRQIAQRLIQLQWPQEIPMSLFHRCSRTIGKIICVII